MALHLEQRVDRRKQCGTSKEVISSTPLALSKVMHTQDMATGGAG
jgi:hypothetical protein